MFGKILVVLFGYCVSAAVFACSCAHFTLEEKVAKSNNIFVVKVNNVETIEEDDEENYSGGTRYGHFDVVKTLKGTSAGATFIQSADKPVCCICQAQVKDNTHYIIFSNDNSTLNYGACGFTRPVHNVKDKIETVEALLEEYKPTEVFSGVYVSRLKVFLNDDGTRSKLSQLRLKDYFSLMSRISFEGVKLKSGKILVVKLNGERALSEQETSNLKEIKGLEVDNDKAVSKGEL